MTQTFLFIAAKWLRQSTLRPAHNLGKGEKSYCLYQMDNLHYQQPILNPSQKDIGFWSQLAPSTKLEGSTLSPCSLYKKDRSYSGSFQGICIQQDWKVDGVIQLDNVLHSHPLSFHPKYMVGLCFVWDLSTDLLTKGDPTSNIRQPTT